jgi:hypothetical protein
MAAQLEKFTITPLDHFHWRLCDSVPIRLEHSLSIQNYRGRLPSVSHWNQYLSEQEIQTLSKWSVCLEHCYTDLPHLQGEEDERSRRFVAATSACLRFLTPSRINGNHCLQLERAPSGELRPFNYVRPLAPIGLEDCESLAPEIIASDFHGLTSWLNWISAFAVNGRNYQPLWISLSLSEKAYTEHYKPIRHVLRVMALESLIADSKIYGRKAFRTRLLPLTTGWDLYQAYASDIQRLPVMPVNSELLKDIVDLRNEIAHGAPVPQKWIQKSGRNGSYNLAYADQLTEAATALVRLLWLHILNNNLQNTFSDKEQMAAYFQSASR